MPSGPSFTSNRYAFAVVSAGFRAISLYPARSGCSMISVFGFPIDVANGVGLGLVHSQARGQHAAIDVDLAHQLAAGIELRGDARAKIHRVTDQPLVAGLSVVISASPA